MENPAHSVTDFEQTWNDHEMSKLPKDLVMMQNKFLTESNINFFLNSLNAHIVEKILTSNQENFNITSHKRLKVKGDLQNEQCDFEEIEEEPDFATFSNIKHSRAFQHLSRCGLRGLKVLSLSECRNFSDAGL